MQNVDRLRGSICPMVTPFNERDEVDEGKLRELIDWQLENGTHGISVTGTTADHEQNRRGARVPAEQQRHAGGDPEVVDALEPHGCVRPQQHGEGVVALNEPRGQLEAPRAQDPPGGRPP